MKFNFAAEPGLARFNRYGLESIQPRISVITPYYNAGKYFEQTFNSIVNQTFPHFEWIIVDDGSTNQEDLAVLDHFAAQDSRIRVYHVANGGAAAARNYAVSMTTTDIFIPVDADDMLEPTFIECMLWTLETNPEPAWAYSGSVTFGKMNFLWKKEFSSDRMKTENICIVTSAIRKKDFLEAGGYMPDSRNLYEDWRLWLALLARGKYPALLDDHLFWYRMSDTGAAAKIDRNPELKRKILSDIREMANAVPDGMRGISFSQFVGSEFPKPYHVDWARPFPFAEGKIRILLLLPHMERGGADKFNLDIVSNIDRSRFEIGIVTTVAAESEWRQLFKAQALDIFELPRFLKIDDWSAFIHYYIVTRQVDVVLNIASYYGYSLTPWLRCEFPEITLYDCVHAESKYWRAGGYPRASAAVDSVLEKTYATNEYTRQKMIHTYGKPPEKIETIYTGVDEQYFDPEIVQPGRIRSKFDIAPDRPVILYLCRISDEKRPFLMLEIAAQMRQKIPNICFMVVGEGPLLEPLKKGVASRHLERTVYFAGSPKDVRPYYADSDLFLICSIKEGLAITTFEAMLMKVPVVSSDVGGQKELVEAGTGILVPCLQDEEKDFYNRKYQQSEINQYVYAIWKLLEDREALKGLGHNCRQKILEGYTLRHLMSKLESDFNAAGENAKVEDKRILAQNLMRIPDIVKDYSALFATYMKLEHSYNALHACSASNELSPGTLNMDESMRTVRLINKYRHFMDHTIPGRILGKIRNAVFGVSRAMKRMLGKNG